MNKFHIYKQMEPQHRRIHLAQRNSLRFLREEEEEFQLLDKTLNDKINFCLQKKSQLNNESNLAMDAFVAQFRQFGQKNENARITNRDRYMLSSSCATIGQDVIAFENLIFKG